MHQETQARLVKRVLALADARTTDREERGSRLPASHYVDGERHAHEVATLFRQLPMPVVHASALAAPGAFVTHDASGVPLLLVRGDDGQVSAFLNVCRHRGARLEEARCGTTKSFVCPYHAWSYARDGRLAGIPHESGFADVDRATRGLVGVPATEACGFVWVRPSAVAPGEDASVDVPAWLGPLASDFEGFGLPTSHVYEPRVFIKEMNWKLAIDVFLESYHFRWTHEKTAYPMFFDNLGISEALGAHLRCVYPRRSILELAGRPESEWVLRKHAMLVYQIFPNTVVMVVGNHAAVVNAWPDGPERTRCMSYTLIPKEPDSEKLRRYWDMNNAILYGTTEEDFAMGESIQRGLASGANSDVVFGAFEHGLRHFHAQVGRHLDTDRTPEERAS